MPAKISMKNKNGDGLPPVKKEQLYSERAFIQHCIHDYHHNRKLDDINEAFLRAAESDGFLEPLAQFEEEVVQEDGTKKKVLVNYYSPHQIFIITQLHNNTVGSDEKLVSKDNFDVRYGNRETGRAITWGWQGMTFEIDYYKPSMNETSIFEICKNFHNYLKLLHTLEESRYKAYDMRKERHFNDAPQLHFDYSPLKGNKEILSKYGLSIDKLKVLLGNVGHTATRIDPLEHWYYYIHRHPQWRKDLFKGEALLAQELYIICDLLSDVVETVSGEKQPPMFEMLYGEKNIHPYLIPRTEYVHGTDAKSMWAAIKKFKDWMKDGDNKDFVEDSTLLSLATFEKELKEYEDKYGARSFISNGVREVEIEENLKLEDLDPKTKHYVEDMIRQAQAQLNDSKRQFLSFWDDELEEEVKSKKKTLEQAKKEDYDLFVKREIFDGIEQRLSSLKRELWAIFDTAQKKIARKVDEAWNIEHNFSNHFWFKRKDELNTLSREGQVKLYDTEYKKAYKEAQFWSKKRDDFGVIEYTMDLLFCNKCRQKPVRLHHNYSDRQISTQYLCDDCFAKIEGRVLDMSAEDWKQVKEGEWLCDCYFEDTDKHPTLYKFAHRNTVSLWSKNNVPIKVELSYGKAVLEAKCPNCGQVQQKELDWGWND